MKGKSELSIIPCPVYVLLPFFATAKLPRGAVPYASHLAGVTGGEQSSLMPVLDRPVGP